MNGARALLGAIKPALQLPAALGLAVLVVALFGGCSSCARAATLRVSGTAPGFDNGGTCTTPTLTPAQLGALVTVHVLATGPAAREDSLLVPAGSPFAFTWALPAGTYSVRAWATDAGGIGCDTTLTVAVKNPPWKVRL